MCNRQQDADKSGDTPADEFLDRSTYLAHRQNLQQFANDSAASLDKYILTLSSGAIGLSLAFLSNVGSSASFSGILFFSWLSLGIAMIATLWSFHWTGKASDLEIEFWDTEYENQKALDSESRSNPFNSRILISNNISLVAFGIGLVSLFLFGVLSIICVRPISS